MSRSFMTECQGLCYQLKGLSLRIVVFKFEDNPFTNDKVIARNSEKQQNSSNFTFNVKVIND
jgi:hypothetical protein